MANPLKFTCPGCGQKVELDEMPDRSAVVCPVCAKDIPLPSPAKAKPGPLIAMVLGGVAVLLAILFIIVFVSVQAKKAEEKRIEAQRAADAAERMKEVKRLQAIEAEKKRWLALTKVVERSKLKTETDFIKAFDTIKNYVGGDPDEKDKLKAQLEQYKAEEIAKVMSQLDSRAQAFGDKKEFIKAVGVYQDYNGDFKPDTEAARKKGAENYFNKADAAAEADKLAKEKAEEAKKEALNELAGGLISGKITESAAKFTSSPYSKEYPDIVKMMDNLNKINEIVIDSFKPEIGKKINVDLKEGAETILIKGVEKGQVQAEYKKEKLTMIKKYSLKDLNDSEVFKRLSAFDEKTSALTAGIKAVKKRQFDDAEKNFQNTGDLAIPLMAKLSEYKENQPVEVKKEQPEEKEKKDPGPLDPQKIKVTAKVTKGGKRNLDLGQVEEKINARLNVLNTTGQQVEGFTVTLVLIGESLNNKKLFKSISQFEEPLKLADRDKLDKKYPLVNKYNAGAEIGVVGRGAVNVVNANPRIVPKSGHKFYSWLWVLKDSSGVIKDVKSKHSKFEKFADKILKTPDGEFTEEGKFGP